MYPYPIGVCIVEKDGQKAIRVSFASKEESCGMVFFDKDTGEEVSKYAFSAENKIGNVYCETITGMDMEKLSYLFYEGEQLIADRHATHFAEKDSFGFKKGVDDYRALLVEENYDWQGDKCPQIPYEDSIVYCMHVRGFTKHSSSGVKAKGTFAGIIEKLPYLKELGITTLELQPAYEFNELPAESDRYPRWRSDGPQINYWGYTKGYYYAPKRSYAKKDAGREFRDMVKALHENGMEVIMQFYFPEMVSSKEIPEILLFWHMNYHVDGFHLMGSNLPVSDVVHEPYLSNCKLWYSEFSPAQLFANRQKPETRKLALYNEDYLKIMRRFLKGDEGQLYKAMYCMRQNPSEYGVINYFSNYNSLTLADMVAYERKHNEANGEENRDGTDLNYSWNWGEEGESHSKQVKVLRNKQQKNAFVMLMLSQGTPLFFMGDEFCNSQEGNNNPYCQDNDIAWLNWEDLEKNKAFFDYVKRVIAFRKEHPIFHQPRECRMIDYGFRGCPDLSYHGCEPWKQRWETYSRQTGIMFCGDYVPGCENKYFYIAVNMYWEDSDFNLPNPANVSRWCLLFSTDEEFKGKAIGIQEGKYRVPARSIVVFEGQI